MERAGEASRRVETGGAGPVDLSLVVPILNEVENLPPLIASIRRALDAPGFSYEVVFVDDGSTDGSRRVLRAFAAEDPRIRVLELRRNFGQTAAMAAGFDHCRGRFVVTMDGDLQNDPADIPRMLSVLEHGADVVCGWRRDRRDRAVTRRLPSWIANRLIASISGVAIHDTGCTLKAYRAWVVRKLHLYSDMHRFIPALAAGAGARIVEIPVRHHPRRYGRSKYGFGRIFRVLTDLLVLRLIVRFAAHPVRYFGLASFPLFAAALVLSLLGLLKFQRGGTVVLLPRWDLYYMTASVVTAITALNLFLLGLLAELSVNVSGFFSRSGVDVEVRRRREDGG